MHQAQAIDAIRAGKHVIVAVERGMESVGRLLSESHMVAKSDDYGNYAELELAPGANPQVLLQGLVSAGAGVTRFVIAEPTLNKIFIDLVGDDAAEAAAVEDVADA